MRRLVFLAIALGAFFASPGLANADMQQDSGYTYLGNPDCAWAQVWIRNDVGQPHLQSVGTMDWWNNGWCLDHTHVAPAGAIAVKQDLIFWNVNVGQWQFCNQGPWVQQWNGPSHEVWTAFAWTNRPCLWGHWYVAQVNAMTFNNGWHGGQDFTTDMIWLG